MRQDMQTVKQYTPQQNKFLQAIQKQDDQWGQKNEVSYGFTLEDKPILLGYWTGTSQMLAKQLGIKGFRENALDKACDLLGIHLGWVQEWTQCQHCYRYCDTSSTSPDEMCWASDCEPLCEKCSLEFLGDVIEYLLEQDRNKAALPTFVPESAMVEQGYTMYRPDDYGRIAEDGLASWASGFHSGQDDTPEKIIKAHPDVFNSLESWVWQISDSNPFTVEFVLWGKPKEAEIEECEA